MKFLANLKSNTINGQIVLAFSTLTLLIIGLEGLAYRWIREMAAIQTLREISFKLKENQMLMKSAANEFILREKNNEEFFTSGKSVFLDRYTLHRIELEKNIREIRVAANRFNVDQGELSALSSAVDEHKEVFLIMVAKVKARGYGDQGLIGEFDKSIQNLLQYDFGSDKNAILNLQLFVKNYLLSGDKKLVDNIANEIFNFTMVLEQHVKDEEVEKVSKILQDYESVFKQLTDVDNDLGIYTGGGLQSRLFLAVDDLDSAVQLKKTNGTISEAYVGNQRKLFLSFFLIVGIAILTAILITHRLFKTLVLPTRAMKAIIERMARGEVPDSAVAFRLNDLSQIADALNSLIIGTRNYRNFAIDIGNGKFDTQFKLLSDHDILGNALITMRDNLRRTAEDARLRTFTAQGLAELGKLLQTNFALNSDLHNAALQFIVRYMQANQAALFLFTSENSGQYLELAACYAWDKRRFINKKIALGEGLLGQCAVERETIHITQLPKDFIKITSGLGEALPTSVLITPLKVADQVLGVLEIASFQKFSIPEIQLVEKFAESVASSIHLEQINRHSDRVLRQAQERAELLRQELAAKLERDLQLNN